MNEFKISDSCVSQRKYLLMMFPIIMLAVAAFTLFVSGYKVNDMFMPLGLTVMAAILFFVLQTKTLYKGMRNIKVFIHDDKIVKELGSHQQAVSWDSIVRVNITENAKGETIFIRLFQKDNKTIYLYGFEDMTALGNFVKAKVSPSTLIQANRYRGGLDDPGIPILLVLFLLTAMAIVSPKTLKTTTLYFSISFVITGCFSLMFRPLTKDSLSLKRFAILEIIAGILLIAIGVGGFFVLSSLF